MPKLYPRRLLRSIFTKLLVVLIATGICMNLLIFGFFSHAFRTLTDTTFHKNIIQYFNYLVSDLGSPPALAQAERIARQTSLEIRYAGPDRSWSTSSVALPSRLTFDTRPGWGSVGIARYHGRHFYEIRRGSERFIFEAARVVDPEADLRNLVIVLLALLTAILAAAYLSIRRILRPIHWMAAGVQRVSRGELEHRVPVKGQDELGQLAEAFNAMTDRLGEMLKAREQLLWDVSHELRSPITRIKVALEFLPDGRAKETIGEDLREMERMVTDILDSARWQSMASHLKLTTFDLVALIREVCALYQGQKPEIRTTGLPAACPLSADREKIRTVLTNLIANALKYSRPDSRPIRLTLSETDAAIQVQIADNGSGIAPEDLGLVFEPFYRADKSRSKQTGGYGLGLSICKAIMQAHGGKIEIASQIALGTTVTLTFSRP
jgi:signal transduction histidine kinase